MHTKQYPTVPHETQGKLKLDGKSPCVYVQFVAVTIAELAHLGRANISPQRSDKALE